MHGKWNGSLISSKNKQNCNANICTYGGSNGAYLVTLTGYATEARKNDITRIMAVGLGSLSCEVYFQCHYILGPLKLWLYHEETWR